jgi:hypothetical protein
MVPFSRNGRAEIVESRSKQTNEHYHYQQYGQPQAPPTVQASLPQVEEIAVPVMLCHTCSECGRMRSAGFHRNNAVIPGKPLVSTPCRRCRKKLRSHRHSRSSYTRIRSCTADEPCDWPRESIHIDIDHDRSERRGRRRSREEVFVTRYSPSRPRIIRRSSSQVSLGLRVLQQPPRELKTETRVRVSSLSPRRSSRYAEIWPPPDIVRTRPSRPEEAYAAPPVALPSRTSRDDEVWPPPDVVRTHPYRKTEISPPLRRTSSRIIELSPSPPPARISSTRIVYRSDSQERRPRNQSMSPARVSFREQRRGEDAEARITAHPRPYRPVAPDLHTLRKTSNDRTDHFESISHKRLDSPSRGILKPAVSDRETSHGQRASLRDSQQSTHVEVGGPRVHFGQDRRVSAPIPATRSRRSYGDERPLRTESYEHHRDQSRRQYIEEAPSAPPMEDFERLRVRRVSVSPRRNYEEEVRIDRARRISPSPPPSARYDERRVRYTSPRPPASRMPRPPPSPPSPERPLYSGYRHVSRARAVERIRSLTPPPSRRTVKDEDHTDSDSAASGEVTEIRSWRGLDENGKPATFVEERKTVRMIEQSNEGGGDFGPVSDRVASRSWRDV